MSKNSNRKTSGVNQQNSITIDTISKVLVTVVHPYYRHKMSEKSQSSADYQIGTHDIDKSTSLGDNSEFVEFDTEIAAIFKRLADDIYDSREAGIREPLQNALTAIRRATDEQDLDEEDGIVEIKASDGEQVSLTLRDNGIGISRSVIKEVLSVIGRSQNRDDGEISGKYGMGFLACYKLVGTNGGFTMYTNSRETEGSPIKGIWKPGGFEIDKGDKLPDKLGEDEYGTLFEFNLSSSISIEDVRDWVEKHARWSRVPILYQEYDSDGNINEDNEFGERRLPTYHEQNKSVIIENEYFTAVASPRAESRTLLLNSPISRNSGGSNRRALGWQIDIRLKNENGVIVEGPNKGLQPVGSEYEDMSEERKKNYVKTEDTVSLGDVSGGDIKLPEPTGTRDTLEFDDTFWAYLSNKLKEKYDRKVRNILDKVSGSSSYLALTDDERRLIDSSLDRRDLLKDTYKKTKDAFENKLDIKVSNDFIDMIEASRRKVWHVNEGASVTKASRKNSSVAPKRNALEVEHKRGNDGDVYMAVSLNKAKMEAVWDENENNQVVRVESSDEYEEFKEYFNWNMLKSVSKRLEDLDISDNIKEKLQSEKKGTSTNTNKTKNADRDTEERHLTVHQEGVGQSGFRAKSLKERFDGGNEYLVLFPSNTEKKISNHWHLESRHVAIANCIVRVYDYLKDADNIYSIDEWEDRIYSLEFDTNNGKKSVKSIENDSEEILLHAVDDSMIDEFREDTVMTEMETTVVDTNNHNGGYSSKLDRFEVDCVTYVPMNASEIDQCRAVFDDCEASLLTLNGDVTTSISTSVSPVDSDVYWYAWARLPRWRNTKEISSFDKHQWTLTPDWVWLIDNLANSEYEVKSISGMDIIPPAEVIKFYTNGGEMELQEIIKSNETVISHVLPLDTVDAFRSRDVGDKALEYIRENARSSYSNKLSDAEDVSDNICYIPMTKAEYENMMNVLENKSESRYSLPNSKESSSIFLVTGEFSFRGSTQTKKYEIESDTAAYAYATLDKEISDVAVPIDEHNVLTTLSDGGLELVETLRSSQETLFDK